MEWIRIFKTQTEALQRIAADKPQLIVIGETRICLVRHADEFTAVQDSCSHNGESLSKGHVNYMGEIICPWHNYCFDTKSGREIQGRSSDLKTFPVKTDDTGFFIGI
jgi:nitrite reductase/ring-hydroxylating ferredoxin subunit